MGNFLVRMTIYAPDLIATLGALKQNRKQSAFLVEALRQFLSTEGGQTLLRSMLGAAIEEERVSAENTSPGRASSIPSQTTDLDDIFRR